MTAGQSAPLGATPINGGVNFSVFSRHASGVNLLFFDQEYDARPTRVISLNPAANRTYYYWHVFVPDVQPGQIYAYRIAGPFDPGDGLRFDPAKVLLDPYSRSIVVPQNYNREAACRPGDNAATAMKPIRCSRLSARVGELLGICPYLIFFPSSGIQFSTKRDRCSG